MSKIRGTLQEESNDESNFLRIQTLQRQISDLELAMEKISMGQVLIHDSDEESCHNEATSPDTEEPPLRTSPSLEGRDRNFKRVLSFDDSPSIDKAQKTDTLSVRVTDSNGHSSLASRPQDVVDLRKPNLAPIRPRVVHGADSEWDTLLRNILTPFVRDDSGSPFKWCTPRINDPPETLRNPPSAQSDASNYGTSGILTPGRYSCSWEPNQNSFDSRKQMESLRFLVSPRSEALLVSPKKRYFLGSSPRLLMSMRKSGVASPAKTVHKVSNNVILNSSLDSDDIAMFFRHDETNMGSFLDGPGSPSVPIHMEGLLPESCVW